MISLINHVPGFGRSVRSWWKLPRYYTPILYIAISPYFAQEHRHGHQDVHLPCNLCSCSTQHLDQTHAWHVAAPDHCYDKEVTLGIRESEISVQMNLSWWENPLWVASDYANVCISLLYIYARHVDIRNATHALQIIAVHVGVWLSCLVADKYAGILTINVPQGWLDHKKSPIWLIRYCGKPSTKT